MQRLILCFRLGCSRGCCALCHIRHHNLVTKPRPTNKKLSQHTVQYIQLFIVKERGVARQKTQQRLLRQRGQDRDIARLTNRRDACGGVVDYFTSLECNRKIIGREANKPVSGHREQTRFA